MKSRLIIFFICIQLTSAAQQMLSKQRVLIGDTLIYTHQSASVIDNFTINEALLSKHTLTADTLANGTLRITQIVQPWYYGTYTFSNDSIHRDTFEVKPLLPNQLFVDTPRVDLNKDIRDIVNYKEKRNYKTLIILGIIVFALLSLILYIFSKIIKMEKGKKLIPFEYSMQLLKEANSNNVADNVQQAIKYYFKHRLQMPVLSATTVDFKQIIKAHSLTTQHVAQLNKIFNETDLIKYAQIKAEPDVCKQLIEQSTQILKIVEQQKIAALEAQKKAKQQNR